MFKFFSYSSFFQETFLNIQKLYLLCPTKTKELLTIYFYKFAYGRHWRNIVNLPRMLSFISRSIRKFNKQPPKIRKLPEDTSNALYITLGLNTWSDGIQIWAVLLVCERVSEFCMKHMTLTYSLEFKVASQVYKSVTLN